MARGAKSARAILVALKFVEYLEPYAALSRLGAGSLGNFNFVFHLGACSSTTETDAEYLRRNNFEYSRDLAAWALSTGVRFVYASSAATYGDGSAGMDDQDPQLLDRLRPLNLYGAIQADDGPARLAAWLAGTRCGAEILQRFWPERRPQGRHAQRGAQELRAGNGNRRDSPIQELPAANTATASRSATSSTSKTPSR